MNEALWIAAWAERPRLLAIARRRSCCRADAEEAVSEAILRCVTHPGLRPEHLPAMLTAVTMRACVDQLRARTVAERHEHRLAYVHRDELSDLLDRSEAVWLSAEMARLADRERAALTARMLGLTVAETADALGVTYKAAESALGRAKAKMLAFWRRTLALLPWPRRRRGATASALVAAAILTAPLRAASTPPSRAVGPRAVVPAAQTTVRTAPTVHRPARLPPSAAPSPAPEIIDAATARRVPTVRTPDLTVGPLRQEPVDVTVDPDDPVGRAERCLREGVAVQVGTDRVAVVCRGDDPPGP